MSGKGIKGAVLIALLSLGGGFTICNGQIPIENGHGIEFFANGMYAPTEMAFDGQGNLFIGSGYEPTWPVGLTPTPVFKVFPDGTTVPFSDPISDPDALTVHSSGDVFVGSYGGVITRIDGITETQHTWLVSPCLMNIDGLRFSPEGDLFAVAIDSPKVHKIDFQTKTVEEFADLSSLGITGMSGIAFEPGTGRVFVASPLQNKIVALAEDGSVVNPEVASGFLFLGFIDFDPSGNNDGFLFAPDAVLGRIFKVDIETGKKSLFIDQVSPGPVGLVFDPQGVLYFNKNYDQIPVGEVHRAWDMKVTAPPSPSLGEAVQLVFESPHDEFVPYGAFIALDIPGPLLPDGRRFPLSLVPFLLIAQSTLDGSGGAEIPGTIPMDQSLIGLEFYIAFITYEPLPFRFLGFSEPASIVIQ